MKKEIEIQQENINKLMKLAKENPTLKIIPMVDTEVVQSDDYGCWLGTWSSAEIDECYCENERIYFKSQDFEELVDSYIDTLGVDNPDVDDEELEEMATNVVDNLKWEKIIAIHIRAV